MQEVDSFIQDGDKQNLYYWLKENFNNFPNISPNSISHVEFDSERLLITIN